jgi:hypothetical protein
MEHEILPPGAGLTELPHWMGTHPGPYTRWRWLEANAPGLGWVLHPGVEHTFEVELAQGVHGMSWGQGSRYIDGAINR